MSVVEFPNSGAGAAAPGESDGRTTAVDTHIGQRIKARRVELGHNQQHVAAALGITYQQLAKYEHGTNRISAGRLVELGKVLGVPVGYFYEDPAGTPDDSDGADGPGATSQEIATLLRGYRSIRDPQVRKSILDLVSQFSGLQDRLR